MQMLRKIIAPAVLAVSLGLAACESSTAPTQQAAAEDYALVMFGEAGSSLEGTMGAPPARGTPFDGRSYRRPFPDSIALSEEQKAEIAALREAFHTAHATELEALKAIFEEAKAAREAGATREEVRAILADGRPIAIALRVDLVDLHYAIWNVFTPAQKAWIVSHRPRRMGAPMVGP
jgi:Spy/CpxP family protein refolding chaperone